MARGKKDQKERSRRRLQVKRYLQLGYSISRIEVMLIEMGFMDEIKDTRAMVKKDIKKVTQDIEDSKGMDIDVDPDVFEKQKSEYVTQQEEIYEQCMTNGSYEAAIKASQNIARAHGITTNEPNVISTKANQNFYESMTDEELLKQAEKEGLKDIPSIASMSKRLGKGKKVSG